MIRISCLNLGESVEVDFLEIEKISHKTLGKNRRALNGTMYYNKVGVDKIYECKTRLNSEADYTALLNFEGRKIFMYGYGGSRFHILERFLELSKVKVKDFDYWGKWFYIDLTFTEYALINV